MYLGSRAEKGAARLAGLAKNNCTPIDKSVKQQAGLKDTSTYMVGSVALARACSAQCAVGVADNNIACL